MQILDDFFIPAFLRRKMNDREVTIYHHPNPEIKSFLTAQDISAPRVEIFRPPLNEDADATFGRLGRIGANIVKEILTIPGVKEVHIKPKEVRLIKERASSWDDIEDQVVVIMKRALRRRRFRVVKDSRPGE
jgi:hypothetical protein